MKGVVLAGGTGSRLDPLTRVTNKHLLPVGDKPMVQWAVDFLREAGVRDLILVTGSDHVEDFRRYFGSDLQFAQQDRAGGIAEALGLARDFVRDERVVVMLADNIFSGPITETVRNFEAQAAGSRRSRGRAGFPSRSARRTSRFRGRARFAACIITSAGRMISSSACRGAPAWSHSIAAAARPSARTSAMTTSRPCTCPATWR